jgi:hypothetical protein
MNKHLDRAPRYHERIRDVLLREWDPIGINEIPMARDEYDSYVGEIYGMLIRHEPRDKLIDHLWWIEATHMALCGNRKKTESVADRLIQLCNEIESDGF